MEVCFSTACCGPVSYYAFLQNAGKAWLEQHEHYRKQTYRNRCMIMAANGPMALSVPVVHVNDQPVREVRIDWCHDWRRQHWNSLESAYQSTPFFDYYQDDFLPLYRDFHPDFLFDWNMALHERIVQLLDIRTPLELTEDYRKDLSDVLDLRDAISPKRPVSGKLYHVRPYTQVFAERWGFRAEMSILDLLFNMGPESVLVLRDSMK